MALDMYISIIHSFQSVLSNITIYRKSIKIIKNSVLEFSLSYPFASLYLF